jgi:hypothetical protein
MYSGRYVLSQIIDLIHRQTFQRAVERHRGEDSVRHFGCRQQFICMAFAQLTWREGLRDIESCLNAKPEALYHLGFKAPIARSTLADANEHRDWRIWEEVATHLMGQARPLYANEDLDLDLENLIYALDSSTIDLSLSLFPWADFRTTKSGLKRHTQLDLRGPIPTCVTISSARPHDVLWLDQLTFEAAAFYLMDRGYLDFARLARIAAAGAFFVTRAKKNLRFTRQHSQPVDKSTGLRCDQIGYPTSAKARTDFPWPLRRVVFVDPETSKRFVFLTNNLTIPALVVTKLYRLCWRIELFFRWIKGHLRLKHYYGTSANAVKTQIWISMCVYLLVAIHHKRLGLPGNLHRTFQLLSVTPFEKVPLYQLLTESECDFNKIDNSNQLTMFDL